MRRYPINTEFSARLLWLVPLGLILVACAAKPVFDTAGINQSLTVNQVQQDSGHQGDTVLWGGLILGIENLHDSTRLEVMAYPLDASQSPQLDEELLGRFMLLERGFLEPVTYAEGRRITVVGKLAGQHRGKVGDSEYIYPLVHSEQLKLWSEGEPVRTFFHIGIGLQF